MEYYLESLPTADCTVESGELEIGKCIVELFNTIINAYKEVKINQDIQETDRIRIRSQAKVCIAMIEADTIKFKKVLETVALERMTLITSLCSLITRPELDDNTVRMCGIMLDYLKSNSPLELINNNDNKYLIG